jgi:uncharacterized protein (DUF58 family)
MPSSASETASPILRAPTRRLAWPLAWPRSRSASPALSPQSGASATEREGARAKRSKGAHYGVDESDLLPGLPPLSPHYDGRFWTSINKTGLVKTWHFWSQTLTPGGRCLAGASVGFFCVGATSLDLQVFVPLCYLTVLWAFALAAAWLLTPRARLTCRYAERVGAGEELPVSFRVESAHSLGRARVVAHRLPPHVEALPPEGAPLPPLEKGESARGSLKLVFRRRGVWSLKGLRLETDAPFALAYAGRVFPTRETVVVHPAFTPLREFALPAGRAQNPGGVALASARGEAMEFWGNREWRQGDRLREIDWRATARLRRPLDRPIVREFREEWLSRVAVVLDTHISSSGASEAAADEFERAVSVCASVGEFLARQDYLVDIFAAGSQVFHLATGRSLATLDQILDILARVETTEQSGWAQLEPALEAALEQVTTLVCVLLDWDDERRAFVRRLVEGGAAVRVVIVRDTAPTHDPNTDAAWIGAASLVDRARFEAGLREM